MQNISWHPTNTDHTNKMFSIFIPTWNNLEMLKICIQSIKKNSKFDHQIIIFINEGTDGTHEWVSDQGFDYAYSIKNVGVCWALNACRILAKGNYFVYVNDDMYLLPEWDQAFWNEISNLPDHKFFLSSSVIEPLKSPHPGVLSPYDFGRGPGDFNEDLLLQSYKELPTFDWHGASWPPNIVHKDTWDMVGGYSIEYSPGLYSDPDFSMKLLKYGIRYFKGLEASKAYHFKSASTGRTRLNKGSRQFLNKWGITAATMNKYLLFRGEPIKDNVRIDPRPGLKIGKIKSHLKRIYLSFYNSGEIKE